MLLPPHHVRPYIRRNKTDRTDAKGILEASRNEDIRPGAGEDGGPADADLAAPVPLGLDARSAPRGSTPCAACCASSESSSPSDPARWCPRCGLSSKTPTPSCPTRCAPIFAEACHEIRDIEARIKQVERQLEAMADQLPVSSTCAPSPASACSPRPRSSPSSATSAAFPRDGTSPASSASRHVSTRAASSATSAASPSAATATCARCSSTARARPCSTHASSSLIGCASGRTSSRRPTCTTRPRSRSPTSSLASSGPSGAASGRTADPARRLALQNNGRSEGTGHPPRAATAKSRDGRTGRTGAGTADNNCGLRGRCHRLASRRADSVMARSSRELQRGGRRYVCSPPRSAHRDPHVASARTTIGGA